MEGFTKKQVGRYVVLGGNHCPNCGSHMVESTGSVEVDHNTAWQEVECKRCREAWHDVYTLTDVRRLDGEGRPLDTTPNP